MILPCISERLLLPHTAKARMVCPPACPRGRGGGVRRRSKPCGEATCIIIDPEIDAAVSCNRRIMQAKFFRYAVVGCGNTLVHWLCFAVLLHLTRSQAISNLLACLIAASFSFIMNARFTFQARLSGRKYIAFLAGMAGISFSTGLAGDLCALHPLFTLIIFSVICFVLGFLYSSYFVFRSDAP